MHWLKNIGESFGQEQPDRRKGFVDELAEIGVSASLAEGKRAEERIGIPWSDTSKGLIDVSEGPVRWIHLADNEGSVMYLRLGVPDLNMVTEFPDIRVESQKFRKFPFFGKVVSCYWRAYRDPVGLGDILNHNRDFTSAAVGRRNIIVRSHPKLRFWVIQLSWGDLADGWPLYETLAKQLVSTSKRWIAGRYQR
jgi:hypothetical protein